MKEYLKDMLIESLYLKTYNKANRCNLLSAEPRFWSSWKGKVIRAIVLHGEYDRNKILKNSGLNEEQFKTTIAELHDHDLLKEGEIFWVNSRELTNEYRVYFEELKKELVDWVNDWREKEGIDPKSNHFFLEDELLRDFSKKLIENAKAIIQIVNPFVDRCHISNSLMAASKRGISVRLVTRTPKKRDFNYERKAQYHSELVQKGVSVIVNESVHAKLVAVDEAVATISSLNFESSSSGGGSWEAGLVTIEPIIVQSVCNAIANNY